MFAADHHVLATHFDQPVGNLILTGAVDRVLDSEHYFKRREVSDVG